MSDNKKRPLSGNSGQGAGMYGLEFNLPAHSNKGRQSLNKVTGINEKDYFCG